MKNCPFCGETIQDEAKKCKHCGQWLQTECSECHQWTNIKHTNCPNCGNPLTEEITTANKESSYYTNSYSNTNTSSKKRNNNTLENMEKTKRCPYCGEEILDIARKCKHCGEWLEVNNQNYQSADQNVYHNHIEEPRDNIQEPPLRVLSHRFISTVLFLAPFFLIIFYLLLVWTSHSYYNDNIFKYAKALKFIILPFWLYFHFSNKGKSLRLYRFKVYGIMFVTLIISLVITTFEQPKKDEVKEELMSSGLDYFSNGESSPKSTESLDKDYILGVWEMTSPYINSECTTTQTVTYYTDGSCKSHTIYTFDEVLNIIQNTTAKWSLNNDGLTTTIQDVDFQYEIIEGDIPLKNVEFIIDYLREEVSKNKVSKSKIERISNDLLKEIDDGDTILYRRK